MADLDDAPLPWWLIAAIEELAWRRGISFEEAVLELAEDARERARA